MDRRPWEPVLGQAQADAARALALEVSDRSTRPDLLARAVAACREQTQFPQAVSWRPQTVAQGDAGLAVLCAHLDTCFPGQGWDVRGHERLSSAARGAEAAATGRCGLFDGLAGVGFAALSLSRDRSRYRRMLASVDAALVPATLALADRVTAHVGGMSVGHFDVISGLSGVMSYLLLRSGDHEAVARAARVALSALMYLAMWEGDRPGWFTPPTALEETMRARYPGGNLNCGLAHGVPGPLAALALARRTGVVVDGSAQAIARLGDWLADQTVPHHQGPVWPTAVAWDAVAVPAAAPVSRTAWCYGNPGVARALWLAGEALDREDYRALAVAAMETVYAMPVAERAIGSPTLCHGVAGLLQVTLRFAHETGLAQFQDAARALVGDLIGQYEPASLLGYRSIEPGDSRVDQPGLLDGAPGVALALLAASEPVAPAWDRLFLLS